MYNKSCNIFQIEVMAGGINGWTYFGKEFEFTNTTSIQRAYRKNGPELLLDYNVWVGTVRRKQYIHLFDYIEDATTSHTYVIALENTNPSPPVFSQNLYVVQVTEGNPVPMSLLQITATDDDGDSIHYSMDDSFNDMFAITDDGLITVLTEIDYEMDTEYTLVVGASDNSSQPRTGIYLTVQR